MLTAPPRLRIAILDRNPCLAGGLAALLEGEADYTARAVEVNGTLEPQGEVGSTDVVVIDPGDFALTPQAIALHLRDLFGDARLIGYAASDSPDLARACLAQGFRAVLSKTASFEALKAALAAVRSGALFLDPRYAEAILSTPSSLPPAPSRGLTEREAYVLKSVARGKSLKEIGYELALSSKTVETYKARGTSKLNISGRREIVEYAIRSGWV